MQYLWLAAWRRIGVACSWQLAGLPRGVAGSPGQPAGGCGAGSGESAAWRKLAPLAFLASCWLAGLATQPATSAQLALSFSIQYGQLKACNPLAGGGSAVSWPSNWPASAGLAKPTPMQRILYSQPSVIVMCQ